MSSNIIYLKYCRRKECKKGISPFSKDLYCTPGCVLEDGFLSKLVADLDEVELHQANLDTSEIC